MAEKNVILIDDDGDSVLSLTRALKASGLEAQIHAATEAEKGLSLLKTKKPQVAVVDLCLDEARGVQSGFELVGKILQADSTCRVIVLTGHGSVELGVKALEMGAANFLEKPAEISHLKALVLDGILQSDLKRSYQNLTEESSDLAGRLIGKSAAIENVRECMRYAGSNNQTTFIMGETGTGKGLCASVIHQISKRSSYPFVRYQPNFAAADLVNSDLFGHVKGAFTGATEDRKGLLAEAHQGTLFLDEIDELPIETQVTLLGVLQEKKYRPVGSTREHEVDFRLICASNRNLSESLKSGKIREDFYHRIAHYSINLPALRERKEDILPLAKHILSRLREKEQVNVLDIAEASEEKLNSYDWPGNVRELEAVVEGAAYRAQYKQHTRIHSDDILLNFESTDSATGSFHDQLQAFKSKIINNALAEHMGNQVQAAKALGLDRSTLRRILAKE